MYQNVAPTGLSSVLGRANIILLVIVSPVETRVQTEAVVDHLSPLRAGRGVRDRAILGHALCLSHSVKSYIMKSCLALQAR